MKRIVAADIGGTHARFGIASVGDGRVVELGTPVTLKTGEHASFETAWAEFGRRVGGDLPSDLAIAAAGPVGDDVLKLTNNPWMIRPEDIRQRIAPGRLTLVNDFGAVAFAVAGLDESGLTHLFGPATAQSRAGVTTIVGPGTGLGIAALLRDDAGGHHVIETEGGHIDFAPLDSLEDRILAELRGRFRRVSVERLASGRGLLNIYEALAAIEQRAMVVRDDTALWSLALSGTDSLASAALDRFCSILGAVAGDIALAQGANRVVLSGALALRLADHLPRSAFHDRFVAKGRFERRMAQIPIMLVTYPEPGLFGAAAAFAVEDLLLANADARRLAQ